jgi:hypothetical protein
VLAKRGGRREAGALAAAISLATLTVAALLWRFRDAAILLALSVVLAAAARPAIEGLEQRVGRSFAVALTYVLGLTLFGVFAYLVSRGVLHELDTAAEQLSAAYDRLRLQAGRSGCGVFERGAPLDAVMGPAGLWSEDRPGDARDRVEREAAMSAAGPRLRPNCSGGVEVVR